SGRDRGTELGDEGRKARGTGMGEARGDWFMVGARGAALGLRTSDRRRKDDVTVVGHGTIRPRGQLGYVALRSGFYGMWVRSAIATRAWIVPIIIIIPIYRKHYCDIWNRYGSHRNRRDFRRSRGTPQLCRGRAPARSLSGRGYTRGWRARNAARGAASQSHHPRGQPQRGRRAVSSRRAPRARRSRGDRTGRRGGGQGTAPA